MLAVSLVGTTCRAAPLVGQMSVSSSQKQKITSEESETAFPAFFRGMADHIFKLLGQDEAAAVWWSSQIKSDSEQQQSGEEQHMLQVDGATGEVDSSRGRGGRRRGRLKKLTGFVRNNIHKNNFLVGAEVRGVGVKRKRGRPRKIQVQPPRILEEEEEGNNCDQPQVKDQYLWIHQHTKIITSVFSLFSPFSPFDQ